jgi:peptidoglycan/LPS O-acetylase OafA/YrhL
VQLQTIIAKGITTLLSAGGAVVLFFVLSGYVLSLALQREVKAHQRFSIMRFYFRRIWRLYPALFVSVVLCYCIFNVLRVPIPEGVFSDWYLPIFTTPPTYMDLLSNLALLSFKTDPVTWTIYIEVCGSLLLPLLFFVHQRINPSFQIALLLLLIMLSRYFQDIESVKYIYCFYAGTLLTNAKVISGGQKVPLHIFFLGYVLLCLADNFGGFRSLFMHTAGAALIIMAVVNSKGCRFFSLLDTPHVRSLGRVSYSFYLLHLPILYMFVGVMMVIGKTTHGLIVNASIGIISIFVSVIVAKAMYRFIEVPGMAVANTFYKVETKN